MTTKRTHQAAAPPYSVASEKIVLASLLRQPQSLDALGFEDLQGEAFFRPEHGKLFEAIRASCIVEPKLTPEALIDHLKSAPVAANVIEDLLNCAVTDYHAAKHHASVVVEKARQRRLIDVLSNILHDAYQNTDGCDAVIKRAKKRLTELQQKNKAARRD